MPTQMTRSDWSNLVTHTAWSEPVRLAFFGIEHPLKFSAYFSSFSDGLPLEKNK